MDQVSQFKKEFRKEQWRKLIAEQQGGDMTVRAFCKSKGIVESTYYRQLRKLREETIKSLPITVPQKADEQPLEFMPLEIRSPISQTKAAVIIHLPSATIEIPDGMSPQTVEAVLIALKKTC